MKQWFWERCTPEPPLLWCCRSSVMLALYPSPQAASSRKSSRISPIASLADAHVHAFCFPEASQCLTGTHLLKKNSKHSLSSYHVSGTILNALHVLTHSVFSAQEIGAIITPMFQMGKLRPDEVSSYLVISRARV